jgi:DNA primase catalytic core
MILNKEDIISRANLIEVITRVAGVDFKRQGANMVCRSPFTDEKTPSFTVSERKGIWKCFSSGVGGKDACDFLMKFKKVSFTEAMNMLSDITGEPVIYDSGISYDEARKREKEKRSARELMFAAIQKSHDFYKSLSPENESQIELAGKVYSPAVVGKWGIVLSGDSQSLDKASKTWKERPALIDAGILAASKSGTGYYDFFHSRVLFPLYDHNMQICGYNGRILEIDPEKKRPKYINSKDSAVFNKSEYVYGYAQNWRSISDKSLAYLCEGPTDVIMMDQYGLDNAVCSSGTAFTMDQAKLIATVADTVIILFDGDKAGQDATVKAIKILIKAQLEAKVKVLPEEHDPASFLMAHGSDEFKELPVIDGLEYILQTELPNGQLSGPHEYGAALMTIANLLADIKEESIRLQYVNVLAKKLNTTATVLKSTIKDVIDSRLEQRNKLSPEQEKQKILWGLYIDNNMYYDFLGNEISNFIIKPLFLVSYKDTAHRIFEITNKYGGSKVINMNSDDFITLMGFRRATEMLGNYVWKGNDAQFVKIREWIYHDMREVYPIEVLGYQPRYKIYAWANGITLPDSVEVIEADEYGIVTYKTDDMNKAVNLFLPAESKVNLIHDEDHDRELETNFKWTVPPSGSSAPRSLSGWAESFAKVFDKNAPVALCWIFAALHRDLLHNRYSMFPHLNLFGPAGSGKTFMAEIITAIFGKPMRAVHLVSSSPVAFYRRIAQTRNAIVWYEEYSEKVSPDKQEALKNFADGFGRITGQMTNNNKTKASPVLNACIISGQILPSHDPALLERCVTLYFDKYFGDKKSALYGEAFKEWSRSGIFSYVACELYSYRKMIETKFADKMEEVRDLIRSAFTSGTKPADRVLNNFSMIATVYLILAEKINLPYPSHVVLDAIIDRIKDQSNAVEGADELSGFWQVIEYLVTKGRENAALGLSMDHYAVEMHRAVTIKVNEKETKTIHFDQDTKLIFLRLNHAHSLYVREGKGMVSRVVEKGTLMHYMKQHRSYVGEMKAKKFNDKPQRCVVFNLEYLPAFEFELTNFLKEDSHTADKTESDGYNPAQSIMFNKENDPF